MDLLTKKLRPQQGDWDLNLFLQYCYSGIMKSSPGVYLVFLFLLFDTAGFSQDKPAGSNYNSVVANTGQFGFTAGPAIYHGDLNVGNFKLKTSTGLAASIYGQYYFSNVMGFRISLYSAILNGGIRYSENNGKKIEDSFTGILLESDFHLIINFSNLFVKPGPRRKFYVYGTVGLGYAGWYSKLTNKVYNYDSLQTDNPLSNFNASMVIPAGLGFYYRAGNRLNLGLEYTFRNYFSDKLDNTVAGYRYDVVHFIALNISFNLGTGLAKAPAGKSRKSTQNPSGEYAMQYPAYVPANPEVYVQPGPQVYVPPPAVRSSQQEIPKMVYPSQDKPKMIYPSQEMTKMVYPGEEKGPSGVRQSRGEFSYSVQILAFNQHRYSAAWVRDHYHINEEVRLEKEGTVERYVVGSCSDMECARMLKEKMRKLGIIDAYIVAYKNGKRHHSVK